MIAALGRTPPPTQAPPAARVAAPVRVAAPAAPAAATPDTFVRELVAWINLRLVPDGTRVAADTPLFADGLIDSIAILQLIAWTERALELRIPDAQIRMDNFHSAARIAEVFASAR